MNFLSKLLGTVLAIDTAPVMLPAWAVGGGIFVITIFIAGASALMFGDKRWVRRDEHEIRCNYRSNRHHELVGDLQRHIAEAHKDDSDRTTSMAKLETSVEFIEAEIKELKEMKQLVFAIAEKLGVGPQS